MHKFLYIGYAIFIGACFQNSQAKDLKIENFKSGLVCPQKPDFMETGNDQGAICFETDTIYLTGQGICVLNGEPRQCDWYGYQFDYQNSRAEDEITCTWASDQFDGFGNPDEIKSESTSNGSYSLSLKKGSGRHYSPQYSIFSYSRGQQRITNFDTKCTARSGNSFHFKFKLIYPVAE